MKRLFFWGCAAVLAGVSPFAAGAQIRLPAIIGDSMALQQRSSDPLWGWAPAGQLISVKASWMRGAPVQTRADASGRWMLHLKTPAAGGPYTIRISGGDTINLRGVMIGEVWICSGQSNMEMPVSGWPGAPVLQSAEEIRDANYPAIRLFTVTKKIALAPQQDCQGSWSACSPATVGSFSATAYFFGRRLARDLKVPIGLIHTSWGGTVAEAWTSGSALRKLGDFDPTLDKIDSIRPHLQEMVAEEARQLEAWKKASSSAGDRFAGTGVDDAAWPTMTLPTKWEAAGQPGLDGIVWFRREVAIPSDWAGRDLILSLGPIDDEDVTWFNGIRVGAVEGVGHWAEDRQYTVPGSAVRAGLNQLAVRVTDVQGDGGIYGKASSLVVYPKGGTPAQGISLAGGWRYHVDVVKPQIHTGDNPNMPTVLYNGMIAPLIPFGIRGAIWYQGESNVGRAAQYARLFPLMISDWRSRWKRGEFPFYYVQIAPFPYGGDGTAGAALRDAQRKTLQLPGTGMAVTLDVGEVDNIHPANKQAVGDRLARWALNKTYGRHDVVYSGPLYKRMKAEDGRVILSFDHAEGGLEAHGPLNSFELAGADGHYVHAEAQIEGSHVVLRAPSVTRPVAVRYGWADTAQPHLFNKAGLPASSFSAP